MVQASEHTQEIKIGGTPQARAVKEYLFAGLIAMVIGLVTVAPYFFSHSVSDGKETMYQLILTHDISNHDFAMKQFEKSVHSGVLYPRWYADANNGYGIIIPNYYPPGFYYATTLVNAIFRNFHTTLFILMALTLAGAGVSMYFLTRTFFSRPASAAAAILYMLLPYFLGDIYFRGALSEVFGFIFMPLAIYFAYQIGTTGAPRHYAGLGLCYGLFLLTNLPVGLIFSYTLAFYACLWAVRESDWRILLRIGTGMALGLCFSAIYWLPAALEMKLVYEYTQDVFPYHRAYINPTPLDVIDPFELTIERCLKLGVLLIIVAGIVLTRSPRSDEATGSMMPAINEARRSQTSLWMILCGATLFMTTVFSYDIGRWLPKLEITVPPFRWLGISMVFSALIMGAIVERLWQHAAEFSPRRLWTLRAAFGLIVVLNLWVSLNGVIRPALKIESFWPPEKYVESSMTPRDAMRPGDLPDTELVIVEPEGGATNITKWQPQRREVDIRVDQPSRVRLKTYNFPGWAAKLDNQTVPFLPNVEGVQLVAVPPGTHHLVVTFGNTPPRTWGTVISGFAALLMFGLTYVDNRRRRALRQHEVKAGIIPSAEHEESGAPAGSAVGQPGGPKTKYAFLQNKRVVIVGLFVLLGLMIVAGIFLSGRRSQTGKGRSAQGSNNATPRSGPLRPDAEVQIALAGRDSMPVATDEQNLNELLSALSTRDPAALDALVSAGKVFQVPAGTSAKVVEVNMGKVRLHVTEGDHLLQEGWVLEQWVR